MFIHGQSEKILVIGLALALTGSLLVADIHNGVERDFQFKEDTFSFQNFSRKQISYEEAYKALKSAEWTQQFPPSALEVYADFVFHKSSRQDGNCWGMAYTVKDYYENPEKFKAHFPEYENLSEVKCEEIISEVGSNQFGQFVIETYAFNGILYFLGIANLEEQIPYIMQQIDHNQPEILTLDTHWLGEDGQHAVLAYNYTLATEKENPRSTVTLNIYDSNFPQEKGMIILELNETGQYTVQPTSLLSYYNSTRLAAETFFEPD